MRPAFVCVALGLSVALATPVRAEPPELDPVVVARDELEPVPIEPNAEPVGVDPSEPDPVPTPEPPPIDLEAPAPEPAPPPTTCKASKRCRGMTATGITVGTLGLAAVGTGIGLLLVPDRPIPDEPAYVTSTRPAGLVTLTLGAGVTLTAVLMLVAARQALGLPKRQRGAAWRIDGKGLHF